MTELTVQTPNESVCHVFTIDGYRVPVRVGGRENGRYVVMFEDNRHDDGAYDEVRERLHRLHIALICTVVVGADPRLTTKSVVRILDRLGVTGAVLVGDGLCAELSWKLAAHHPERFRGLVVVDAGHPRVPDTTGVVRDADCPHVDVDTTVLVSTPVARSVAQASRRYVHGDFRLTEMAGWRGSKHFAAQLATEVVLRSYSW
ncbi:alpha/beta fold hydrolase [Mycobacterium xenopi]|uniref:Alpha/beta hydrolase n=2 Tax=Mycobacterium xenopi TaxID=1789 RepID=A0AAD1GWS5_MYCXE|nr:alpha/beta hydrolase [Mycobacterium xenopi]EUA23366.1 hypothetical protein I553_5606 [Mycobacterium xenopi 4042]MDA3641636.1 alpha/beta hydrolase [Mycobacterium xenopi]MDA3659394.1 alpha/beta hydrolase [Mycobacterium xenopi]MDA3663854.1 alpha/beta hydrolase [Mycobacterium xenopi]ORX13444.1 hypothetical protein AWC32_15495 [Mycobacterium xenopi]